MENKTAITYTEKGDYLYPDLEIGNMPMRPLGKYGMMRKDFLQEKRKITFSIMAMKDELFPHCLEIEDQAEEMMEHLVKQMKESEGVTDALKAADQLGWVRKMESIMARAEEIVLHDVVYA